MCNLSVEWSYKNILTSLLVAYRHGIYCYNMWKCLKYISQLHICSSWKFSSLTLKSFSSFCLARFWTSTMWFVNLKKQVFYIEIVICCYDNKKENCLQIYQLRSTCLRLKFWWMWRFITILILDLVSFINTIHECVPSPRYMNVRGFFLQMVILNSFADRSVILEYLLYNDFIYNVASISIVFVIEFIGFNAES